uniref:Uncharacterized protein n=1 Tax=Ditylenchus dipsaci TaxID=166011 RepID=A0A915ET41_9BILA
MARPTVDDRWATDVQNGQKVLIKIEGLHFIANGSSAMSIRVSKYCTAESSVVKRRGPKIESRSKSCSMCLKAQIIRTTSAAMDLSLSVCR